MLIRIFTCLHVVVFFLLVLLQFVLAQDIEEKSEIEKEKPRKFEAIFLVYFKINPILVGQFQLASSTRSVYNWCLVAVFQYC